MRQLGAIGALVLMIACPSTQLLAEPIFLGVTGANESTRPLGVMTGGKVDLILTLTAAGVIEPELSADLSLVGGTLTAPLVKGARPRLHRMGAAQTGVQRFQFSLEIPAAEKPQQLVLGLKVKVAPAEAWLPLPVVALEASPRTWKQTLQQFTHRIPSGRLAGGEHVDLLFEQAGIETPETAVGRAVKNPAVLAWFAEGGEDELRLPETPAPAVWLVFKKNVPGGIELHRLAPHGTLYLLVDEQALVSADTNPAAQTLLERALAFATALTSSEPDLSPP